MDEVDLGRTELLERPDHLLGLVHGTGVADNEGGDQFSSHMLGHEGSGRGGKHSRSGAELVRGLL